jgi:hypothetical protein
MTFSFSKSKAIIMKKIFILLLAIVFIANGCNKSKQSNYTLLTEYAPYMEKMDGMVAKVTERMYWALADGDNFKKGNLVTGNERDSLKWYRDCEITFDTAGDIVNCMWPDENNKIVGVDLFSKENNKLALGKWIWGDTLQGYSKFKCNEEGIIVYCAEYKGKPDTLNNTWTKRISKSRDTVEYQNFDYKGVLTYRNLNFYNDKGQQTGWESYNKDGVFDGSGKISYNNKGKPSEWTMFDKDKKILRVISRTYPEYDNNNNWVKAITKDNKGHTLFSERTYFYFQ